MKKLLLLTIVIIVSVNLFSQSIVISSDPGAVADESAILDIQSTGKGLLISRMTTAQRTADWVSDYGYAPAIGLFIFDTDLNAFFYYNGTDWKEFSDEENKPEGIENDDKDTKVYVMGNSDTIYFMTNGVDRLIIDTLGNVGIGTITPTTLLELYKAIGDDADVELMAFSTGTTDPWKLKLDTASNIIIIENTGGSTATAGTVPTELLIKGSGTQESILAFSTGTTDPWKLKLDTASSIIELENTGGSSAAAGTEPTEFEIKGSGTQESVLAFSTGTTDPWKLKLDTASSIIQIENTDSSEDTKVVLKSATDQNSVLAFNAGAQTEWAITADGTATDDIVLSKDGTDLLTINSSGQVGIGTAPAVGYKLDVEGDIHASGILRSGNTIIIDGILYTINTHDNIAFQVNGTEYMRFANSGNFGIGTTTPSAFLHVKGSTATNASFRLEASATEPTTPNSGDLWWNGGNLFFNDGTANFDILAAAGSSISGSGVANQLTFWNGANAITSSGNLFWDSADGQLGVGTSTPIATIHAKVDIGGSSTTYGLYGENISTATGDSYGGYFTNSNPSSSFVYGARAVVTPTSSGSGKTYGMRIDNNSTSSGNSYGVYIENTNANASICYGERTYVSNSSNNPKYGLFGQALGTTTSSTKFGVYGTATEAGSINYGIYGTASGATTNWAGYFDGEVNITGQLTTSGYKFPSTAGIAGQLLSTDGTGSLSWTNAPQAIQQLSPSSGLTGTSYDGSTSVNDWSVGDGDGITVNTSDVSVNVDGTSLEITSDILNVKDGGIDFPKLKTYNTATDLDILTYKSTSELEWKNKTDLGLVSGTGAANNIAFWSDANTLSKNDNLWWDNTNSRLGIGKINPTVALDVSGTGIISSLAINTSGATPNASAIVDISSTTGGLLIPRMTTAERVAISSPATSLFVYDTSLNSFYYFTGSAWEAISTGSSSWKTTGNAGTSTASNFIGTTDANEFQINTNGAARLNISLKGQIEPLNTGSSVFIGTESGEYDDLSSNNNVYVGFQSGTYNISGSSNTAVGYSTLFSNTGSSNTAIGYSVLTNNSTGSSNTSVGQTSLFKNEGGGNNTALGNYAGYTNISGNNNLFLGHQAGYKSIGSGNIFIGKDAGYNETGSNKLYIHNSNTATPMIYGEFDNYKLEINASTKIKGALQITDTLYDSSGDGGNSGQILSTTTTGTNWIDPVTATKISDNDANTKIQVEEIANENKIRFDLDGTEHFVMDAGRLNILNNGGSVFIGENAGLADDNVTNYNVFVGYNTGYTNNGGNSNVAIGALSLYLNDGGSGNCAIGREALYNSLSGGNNVAIGRQSMNKAQTGNDNNVAIGYQSMFGTAVYTSSLSNTAIGMYSLYSIAGGDNNVAVGYTSLYKTSTGSTNVALGVGAGHENSTGSGNVFLGYNAGYGELGNNKLYIDNSNTSAPLIHGDFDANALTINGSLKVTKSMTMNVKTVTNTDYNITADDNIILVSTGTTTRDIYLPSANTCTGKVYTIKKIDSAINSVVINTFGTQTIDGNNMPSWNTQYRFITIISDGLNWHIIAEN